MEHSIDLKSVSRATGLGSGSGGLWPAASRARGVSSGLASSSFSSGLRRSWMSWRLWRLILRPPLVVITGDWPLLGDRLKKETPGLLAPFGDPQ